MLAESVGNTGNGGDGGGAEDYILIRDEKANNTQGGTFTSGIWHTRDLNTIVDDAGNHASLAANQITLAAGTYRVKAKTPAFDVSSNRCKLYNITDTSDIIPGSSNYAAPGGDVFNNAPLAGRFIINSPKVLELQHRSSGFKVNTGYGVATNFGEVEIYSSIEFWKEA